jgi:PAS domain S-box-containing protein
MQTTLPRSVRFLIGGAVAAGIACVAIRVPEIARWTAPDVAAVAVVALATILAERCSIPLKHGSETVNFALTDGVWAAALLLVRPGVLTMAVLLGVGLGQALNGWSSYKIAYNVAQFLVGITLAEAVAASLGIGGGPADPARWGVVLAAMSVAFLVNAASIVLVISMVQGKRFVDVLRPPLLLNVSHWIGNMALGILAATLWSRDPAALILLSVPVGLAYLAYRRWVESVGERDQMRDLYEAGRALSGPLAPTPDFGDFLELLEQLLPADRVELVVADGDRVDVHGSDGVRSLTVGDGPAAPLEAFVAVRDGVAPQIAIVGDGEDVRGVVAVYREQPLATKARLLLDGLAAQIAVRLQNHRLYGRTLERAQLSDMLEHTSDGVLTVDHRGRIAAWNPAMESIVGFAEAEALGRRCEDLLGLEVLELPSAVDAPDLGLLETVVRTKDGSHKELHVRTSAIRDHAGAPGSHIVIVRDATAESRAEKIKRDFVSMVSHELRTPLTPLKGFLKSMLDGSVDDSPEARHEYYRIMLRQAERLERLLGDLLDASQIEAGGLVVDPQPFALDRVVERQVSEFSEQHRDRAVTLDGTEGSVLAFADPFRVEQVLLNLLSNAGKYSRPGAPIEVCVTSRGPMAIISVRDYGDGIPERQRDRIFERFFRLDDDSSRQSPGTGLGLFIARTLVETMSGSIWLASEIGAGSTFSFSVPVVDVVRVGATKGGVSVAESVGGHDPLHSGVDARLGGEHGVTPGHREHAVRT